nr:hypothetical protein Iba_chr05cCG10330 [Ipomoea batatas]
MDETGRRYRDGVGAEIDGVLHLSETHVVGCFGICMPLTGPLLLLHPCSLILKSKGIEEYGAFLVELRFERFIEDEKKQFGVTHKGIARRNRSNEGGTLWAHGRPHTRLDARLRTLATSRA